MLLHQAYDIASALGLSQVTDLLPAEARPSLEDLSLEISRSVSRKEEAQIGDMIANALAVAKVRS